MREGEGNRKGRRGRRNGGSSLPTNRNRSRPLAVDRSHLYLGRWKWRTGKCRTRFWRTISQEQWHSLQWSSVVQCNTASLLRWQLWFFVSVCFCSSPCANTVSAMGSGCPRVCVKCPSWLLMLSRCFSQHNWMICCFWASCTRVFCFIIWATVVLQFPPALFFAPPFSGPAFSSI